MSDAGAARAAARAWITTNADRWPGLRAAHLVGGLAALPDDAPFPAGKDIDLHFIFDPASPALIPTGPFPEIIEEPLDPWAIEAGLKSADDYASPAVVLANPEIAHHLTSDSILYDPDGLLAQLQGPVRAGYPLRRWVEARLGYERGAFAGVQGMLPMAIGRYGVGGGVMMLGYLSTFPAAAFDVAALEPPRGGARMLAHLRDTLRAHERGELFDELLEAMGVPDLTPDAARAELARTAEIFDRAAPIRRTPHPFQHKLHPHLRHYLVSSVTRMIDAGNHREGIAWSAPYRIASLDVLQADGDDADRAEAARELDAFLASMGFTDMSVLEAKLARVIPLYEAMFDLADEIARRNPAVID